MADVPYISQIDNSKRGNDCGLAAALSIARWVGKGDTTTVDALSSKFDTAQNGTNAADLGAALKSLGLHPTYGVSTYPYITLVHYPRLPLRYDKKYEKLHWIVRLSDTEYHDPLWPGLAGAFLETTKAALDDAETKLFPVEQRRIGIVEVPVDNGDSGGTKAAPPVVTIIRPPYDKTYHVCIGGTQAQRDSVYLLASKAGHSATCSADDGALDLLQMTPTGVSEFNSRTIYFYGVTDQAAFRAFVAGAHPGTRAPLIEFRSWPGDPKPAITMTALPATITAGQSSTVSWSAPQASSATLNGAAVAATQSTTVQPIATTTYTLAVKYADGTTATKAVTVTVNTVTQPPPTPTGIIRHGCHVRTDAAAARDAVARGCRCIQIMDHFDVARELAAAYPDAIIMHRKWAGLQNYKLTGAQIAALMENCGGRVWLTLLNEQDQYAYGTAAEIRTRAAVEIDAARILLARGERVLLGGFSMGTPNWLDASICQAFRETYAAFLNADTTGRVGLNFHLYSPYPGHMQGQVRRQAGAEGYTTQGAPDGYGIVSIPAQTKNGDTYVITKLMPTGAQTRPLSRALDLGDDRIWYEGRWRFALDPAYGNVKPTIPIMSDEWGLDEGGVGGGPAHGWGQTEWLAWCNSCTTYQKQPVIVNGTSYQSPLRGGTVFQCSSASGWEGYFVPPGVFQPIWQAGQG